MFQQDDLWEAGQISCRNGKVKLFASIFSLLQNLWPFDAEHAAECMGAQKGVVNVPFKPFVTAKPKGLRPLVSVDTWVMFPWTT